MQVFDAGAFLRYKRGQVSRGFTEQGGEEMGRGFITIIGIAIFALSGHAQSGIGGVRWELTEMNGKGVNNPRAFIEFDESTSRFTGNASCNRIFGGYELAGQRFKAKQVGTTKMACTGNGAAKAETQFLKALKNADRLSRTGNALTIGAAGERVLRFRRARRPEGVPVTRAPTARKWMLRSIGGVPVSLKRDSPFLNFDSARQSAGGNTGCNSFGGEYEAIGESIKFSNMIMTMRACEFEDRMSVQRNFMDSLQAADRFRIAGNKLEILTGVKVVLEFEGVAK